MPSRKQQLVLPHMPDEDAGIKERLANIEAMLSTVTPKIATQMSANQKRAFKARQRNAAHAAGLDIETFLAMAGNVDTCPPCLHRENRKQFKKVFAKWGRGA